MEEQDPEASALLLPVSACYPQRKLTLLTYFVVYFVSQFSFSEVFPSIANKTLSDPFCFIKVKQKRKQNFLKGTKSSIQTCPQLPHEEFSFSGGVFLSTFSFFLFLQMSSWCTLQGNSAQKRELNTLQGSAEERSVLLAFIQHNKLILTHTHASTLYSSYNLLPGSERKSLERLSTGGSKLTNSRTSIQEDLVSFTV